jgi:hypothetical protein
MSNGTGTVYLVINPELGWDNVYRVYDADVITVEELEEFYPENEYVILEKTIHTSING